MRRLPAFAAGDRVRVHFQVVEGERRRTQVFEGIVIKRQGGGMRESFTVRKQSFGVGVERTFPVHSPKVEQIEVVARGDVRRAKLYYLRERVGRGARVRERRYVAGVEELEAEAEAGAMPEDEEALRPGEEELAESEAARAEAEAESETDAEAEPQHEGGEPEPAVEEEETDAGPSGESAAGDAPAAEEEPEEQGAERASEGES